VVVTAGAGARIAVLPELDASTYERHLLHAEDRVWVEKNCYVDIWIEALHALGCDPMAMLPFVVAIDFEGDQWTFFKPPHEELRGLYGLDVQELNVWRPLIEHAREHLGAGKLISTEADAFWLPDTHGTDYRRQHTKTTIVLNDLDLDHHRLGYFHNAGYFAVDGEDFDRLLRIGAAPDPTYMPLFAELIRSDRIVRRDPARLRAMSAELLRTHVARRPTENPVVRFGRRFDRDLAWLTAEGLAFYHAWAFATVRQLGAAAELAALYVRWLGAPEVAAAGASFDQISNAAKALILKGARAVNGKRPLDASALFAEMAGAWERAMDLLTRAAGI
jgi:hypothetical protein